MVEVNSLLALITHLVKRSFLYLWQLPQNMMGLIITRFCTRDNGFWRWNLNGSISLGNYVILSWNSGNITLRHEQGHQKQSLYLGWLYLPVIGLPSILWASMKCCGLFNDKSYYWFYTEKWADELANVKR